MEIEHRHKILIVDDVPGNIKVLANALKHDYRVLMATNGEDAMQMAESEDVDIILLDVVMPGMDGFEVCQRLKENRITRKIPVIFTTGRRSAEEIAKGLLLGAFYYLTKPIDIKILNAVIQSAVERRSIQRHMDGQIQSSRCPLSSHMQEALFTIRTMEDASDLSVLLSLACPDAEKISLGLRELLVNAVEHGNLGITYQEKTILNRSFELEDEIKRRLELPENRSKQVTVSFSRKEREICIRIKDEGKGFNWKAYLDFNPERMLDTHGRGIAIAANSCFDRMLYHGTGNDVECVIIF